MPAWMIRHLREADWLHGARARAYARILLVISALVVAGLWLLSPRGIDPRGQPIGTDFSSFWAASKLALGGQPWRVYDGAAHYGVQQALFGPHTPYYAFFYPPVFLLICLPLALIPYLPALAVWLAVTGAAFVAVIRRWAGPAVGLAPVIAYPAVFITIGHGQNAFLTAALFGAGAMWLDRRPWLAGALLGALVFKPHLAIVVPVALAASGRWRPFLAAGLSAAALSALSAGVFGLDTWRAFMAAAPQAAHALEWNLVGPAKMPSVYAAVRLLGGDSRAAYLAQIPVTLAVCAAVALLARWARSVEVLGAVMACAAVMASPFLLDYDLTLLAIPLAFAAGEGVRGGFLPWEKTILLAAFVLPAVARPLAQATHVPLSPVVIGLLFWSVGRRVFSTGAPDDARSSVYGSTRASA